MALNFRPYSSLSIAKITLRFKLGIFGSFRRKGGAGLKTDLGIRLFLSLYRLENGIIRDFFRVIIVFS